MKPKYSRSPVWSIDQVTRVDHCEGWILFFLTAPGGTRISVKLDADKLGAYLYPRLREAKYHHVGRLEGAIKATLTKWEDGQ